MSLLLVLLDLLLTTLGVCFDVGLQHLSMCAVRGQQRRESCGKGEIDRSKQNWQVMLMLLSRPKTKTCQVWRCMEHDCMTYSIDGKHTRADLLCWLSKCCR